MVLIVERNLVKEESFSYVTLWYQERYLCYMFLNPVCVIYVLVLIVYIKSWWLRDALFCFDFRAILSSWKRIEMMISVITYLLLPPGSCVRPQYHLGM